MDEDDAEDDVTTDEIKEIVTAEEQIVTSESKGGECKSLFSK